MERVTFLLLPRVPTHKNSVIPPRMKSLTMPSYAWHKLYPSAAFSHMRLCWGWTTREGRWTKEGMDGRLCSQTATAIKAVPGRVKGHWNSITKYCVCGGVEVDGSWLRTCGQHPSLLFIVTVSCQSVLPLYSCFRPRFIYLQRVEEFGESTHWHKHSINSR